MSTNTQNERNNLTLVADDVRKYLTPEGFKELLYIKGVTPNELAKRLGKGRQYGYDLIRSIGSITIQKADEVFKALGLEMELTFKGVEKHTATGPWLIIAEDPKEPVVKPAPKPILKVNPGPKVKLRDQLNQVK